jgi:hypothetical protein
MLIIRDAQREAFDEHRRVQFISEIAHDLSVRGGPFVQALEPDRLLQRVEAALAAAKQLGLGWRSSLTLYVLLAFEFGPDFHTRPIIREYLENAGPLVDEMFLSIDRGVSPATWYKTDPVVMEQQWSELAIAARAASLK